MSVLEACRRCVRTCPPRESLGGATVHSSKAKCLLHGLHTSAGNMQCEQGFALAGQRNIVRASPCCTHNTVCDALAQRPPDDRCATVGLQG